MSRILHSQLFAILQLDSWMMVSTEPCRSRYVILFFLNDDENFYVFVRIFSVFVNQILSVSTDVTWGTSGFNLGAYFVPPVHTPSRTNNLVVLGSKFSRVLILRHL